VTTLDAASTIKSPFVCEIAEIFSTTQKLSPQQRKPALDSSATAYFLRIPIQETGVLDLTLISRSQTV